MKSMIQSYFIYSQLPRAGKTHQILSHICANYKNNHIYQRMCIDEKSSITTLLNSFIKIPKDIENKKIIIHFDINCKVNTQISLFIKNLIVDKTLKDETSSFSVNDQMVFYLEFGSFSSYDDIQNMQNQFKLADYIEEIKIPEIRDFFSYIEYDIKPYDEFPNFSKIISILLHRKYYIDAAIISNICFDTNLDYLFKNMNLYNKDFGNYYFQLYDQYKNNPKNTYDSIIKMFESFQNKQNLLLSQINDICKIISITKKAIFNEIKLVNTDISFCYIRLLCKFAIDTAIANSGLSYNSKHDFPEMLRSIKDFILNKKFLFTIKYLFDNEYQNFKLLFDDDFDFTKFLSENGFILKDDSINQLKTLFNISDHCDETQNRQNDLFENLADISSSIR